MKAYMFVSPKIVRSRKAAVYDGGASSGVSPSTVDGGADHVMH
jgi:hypothetical protein